MHVMGGGDVGGAKTHIMNMVTGLNERNEVMLLSFRAGPFADEARERGIDVRVIERMSPFRAARAMRGLVDEFKPDIIHCHGGRANLMGAMVRRSRKIPVITTVHSDYKLDYLGNPVKQHTFGTANAVALRFLDFYQPVADRMARTLIQRGFDPERIVKIYNGMEFKRPEGAFDRAAYLKETYGAEIAAGDVLVGIAARLTAVKDIATTVRGFAEALEEAPRLRLFIAGDGEDLDMLQKLASKLGVSGRVTFCGWVSPVEPFFRSMDINVLSSVSETFPYSILEGVCAGCATVSSDVGGMPELIDTGENGYIFPVGDAKQLARYLARLGNDAALRKEFADKLYEKASRDFSKDKMCERQEENYRHVLARFHTPKDARRDIVICGAYGRGNAGDDAILEAIVQEMRALDPSRPICVMSRRPKETRLVYRTGAIYTFNVFAVLARFRRAALYINGGGSLMQDVTSTRSIWYYCYTLHAAKRHGCKVMMYGCGIGPINRAGNRRMAARVIERSVDRITLRDDNSRTELARMGVTSPDIRVSADPTIILDPAPREVVNLALEQSGIDPAGRYIGFGLRNWRGLEAALPEIAAAATYAYEKHGLTPVFVPIEFPNDLMPAERVGALLKCPWHAIRTRLPIETTIGILARMETVVGIRLHSLMFSAGQGVPVVGMSYDIKVDGFLKYIGSRTCLQLKSVRAADLCALIDECVSGALDGEVRRTAEMLREREQENVNGAAILLGLEEENA
ncbi:polysaccharide pyruvyl transferase CsaB [Agathobaculum sp.]|uniref:polysaccharide pyruvyl transferase CsaB n=1 Tax=Agathobaculum sp. TaxID=2048138 RepID=UPI002A81E8AD|nr:polysaccharide pyruvyl transferase CsaB [Agathobaculum sp.]MDY3619422.1 polysaccharide pyruvyl transferase CsaB [Agathobaculum sp.]